MSISNYGPHAGLQLGQNDAPSGLASGGVPVPTPVSQWLLGQGLSHICSWAQQDPEGSVPHAHKELCGHACVCTVMPVCARSHLCAAAQGRGLSLRPTSEHTLFGCLPGRHQGLVSLVPCSPDGQGSGQSRGPRVQGWRSPLGTVSQDVLSSHGLSTIISHTGRTAECQARPQACGIQCPGGRTGACAAAFGAARRGDLAVADTHSTGAGEQCFPQLPDAMSPAEGDTGRGGS